ncbi:hypothetical protein GB937_000498 [Aspergillus fischeri]|nr:hypothetical protein GB937_000498 [Aspergillus fischeri]
MRYAIHEYFDMRRIPLSAQIRTRGRETLVRYPLTPADPVSKAEKGNESKSTAPSKPADGSRRSV